METAAFFQTAVNKEKGCCGEAAQFISAAIFNTKIDSRAASTRRGNRHHSGACAHRHLNHQRRRTGRCNPGRNAALNLTVFSAATELKLPPAMVTSVPGPPVEGLMDAMEGESGSVWFVSFFARTKKDNRQKKATEISHSSLIATANPA